MATEDCNQAIQFSFRMEIKLRSPRVYRDEKQQKAISTIGNWLTTKGYKSGILLQGAMGNGKTTMLRALRKLISHLDLSDLILPGANSERKLNLWVVDATKISSSYLEDRDLFQRYKEATFLAVDDLGVENDVVRQYGNLHSPFGELLSYRYENRLPTIITTNLLTEHIEKIYGTRIAERIMEMTKKIVFSDYNYRRIHAEME